MVSTKMAVIIKVYKPWALVLHLLIENVGPMLHSNPIIFWHGKGWHMTFHPEVVTQGESYCNIQFDREADAIWFSLRWV
jgi:hypothetical protein